MWTCLIVVLDDYWYNKQLWPGLVCKKTVNKQEDLCVSCRQDDSNDDKVHQVKTNLFHWVRFK